MRTTMEAVIRTGILPHPLWFSAREVMSSLAQEEQAWPVNTPAVAHILGAQGFGISNPVPAKAAINRRRGGQDGDGGRLVVNSFYAMREDEVLVLDRLARASVWSLESNPDMPKPDSGDNREGGTFEVDLSDKFSPLTTGIGVPSTTTSPSWGSSSEPPYSPASNADITSSSANPPLPLAPTSSQLSPLIARPATKLLSQFSSQLFSIRWKDLMPNFLCGSGHEEKFEWVSPTRDWPFNDSEDESTSTYRSTMNVG
ncbi:hypothetical protein BD779DRAFT_633491 [Infundibulicybe gibba]|nr:hypothetical protein BD779DRAFT_633491 [Infundibulicybe gibba]